MKNRLLTFILSICFIIPSVFIFSACGKDPEAQVTAISATVVNADLNSTDGVITFTYGEEINLSKSDFEVTATYSDGTSGIIDNYNLDTSELTSSTPNSGYYNIYFSLNGCQFSISVYVEGALLSKPTGLDNLEVEYTGESINILNELDRRQTEAGLPTVTSLINEGKVSVDYYGETSSVDAGYKSFYLNLGSNYLWESDFGGDSSSLFVEWKINPKVLPLPTCSNSELEYKHVYHEGQGKFIGQEQGPEINLNGLSLDMVNVEGTESGSDCNNYCLTYTIKEEYENNYTFAEDNGNYYSLWWSITEMELTEPTLSKTSYTYTEEGEDIVIEGLSALGDFVLIEGSLKTGEARNHTITISINPSKVDSVYNYIWKNSQSSSSVSLNYTVEKADFVLPENLANNFVMSGEYFGLELSGISPTDLKLSNSSVKGRFLFINNEELNSNYNTYVSLTTQTYGLLNANNMIGGGYEINSFEFAKNAKNQAVSFNKAGTYYVDILYYKDINNYNPAIIENAKVVIETYKHVSDYEWESNSWQTLHSSYTFNGDSIYHIYNTKYDQTLLKVADVSQVIQKGNEADNYSTLIEDAENCKEVGYYQNTMAIVYKTDTDGVLMAEKITIVDANGEPISLLQTNKWQIAPYEFNLTNLGDFDTNFNEKHSFYATYAQDNIKLFYKENMGWAVSYENLSWNEKNYYQDLDMYYWGEDVSTLILNDSENAPTLYYEKLNGDIWETVETVDEIGKYRARIQFNLRTNVVLAEDSIPTYKFEIISNEVDFSNIGWQGDAIISEIYKNDYIECQKLTNVPEGVKDITPKSYIDAELYQIFGELQVPSYVTVSGVENFTSTTADEITTYKTNGFRNLIINKFEITKEMLESLFVWDYDEENPIPFDGDQKTVRLKLVDVCPEGLEVVYNDFKTRSYNYSIIYDNNEETTNSASEAGTYVAIANVRLAKGTTYIHNLGYANYFFSEDCRFDNDSDYLSINFELNWEISM